MCGVRSYRWAGTIHLKIKVHVIASGADSSGAFTLWGFPPVSCMTGMIDSSMPGSSLTGSSLTGNGELMVDGR